MLGSVLLDPATLAELRSICEIKDFFVAKHRDIYAAMLALDNRDVGVDTQTIISELLREDQLDKIGGPLYLSDLAAAVPTSTNARYYAEIVRDRADLRRTIDVCNTTVRQAHTGAIARELLIDIQSKLDDIAQRRNRRGVQSMPELFADYKSQWDNPTITGLRTGIATLDKWLPEGIAQDATITIGARPSDGKSAFVQNLLINIGVLHGPGLLCSIEERANRVMRRLHRIVCSHEEMIRAWENERDLAARDRVLNHALEKLQRIPLFINDSDRYIEDLRYSIKAHVMRHPETTFIAFDYFQLIRSKNERLIGREKYDYILDQIMEIKEAVNRPIIILSQFRKEQIDPKRGPHLGLLKETGRLEADSDIAILLWDPYRDEDKEKGIVRAETELVVDLAKNRDARPKKIRLRWLKLQFLILGPGEKQTIYTQATPSLFGDEPTKETDPLWTGKPRERHPDEYARSSTPGNVVSFREPGDEPPEESTPSSEPHQGGFPWEDE